MGSGPSSLKNIIGVITALYPPKTKFTWDMVPDLTGKVVIVTGANAGIGKETVKTLLRHNAKVYAAARSRAKAEIAIAEIKAETGREPIFLELDLASLASVKRAADEFLSKELELHILFNNAGVMWPPLEQVNAEGFDMQFGTNVLGHWYFTELLVPALAEGAKTSTDGYSRVVTTSSSGSLMAPSKIHWESFRGDHPSRKKLGPKNLYYQSKLLNATVAHEAAKRYADKKILSFSCSIKTELQRYVSSAEMWFVNFILHPTPYGVLTLLYAGTTPEAVDHNGGYFVPWARPGRTRDEAYDPVLGAQVWEYCEEQVKNMKP